MDLATKLQLRPGQSLRLVNVPAGLSIDLRTADAATATVLLVFVRTNTELAAHGDVILASARADRLTWVAYPKACRLGTDLNRDRLAAALRANGVQPVRQVSLDETWSALRFRPA
jgi:phage-related baseplate assembly protein